MSSALDTWARVFHVDDAAALAAESTMTARWPTPAGTFVTAAPALAPTSPSPTRAAWRAAPRAYLLLGEAVTARAVGHQIFSMLPAATGVLGTPVPDELREASDAVLGAAAYRIATELTFGIETPLSAAEADRHWTVGTLFPLPVWATDVGTTRTWHLDVDRLTAAVAAVTAAAAAAPLPLVSSELTATRLRTRALDAADSSTGGLAPFAGRSALSTAMAYRAGVEASVGAGTVTAATGTRFADEARWNPYAVLFALVETSLALEKAASANAGTFAAAFWDALTPPERTVLNTTSAGHAWLRRLWSWWGRGAASATLRTSLGLTNDDLLARSPGVGGHDEPPLPGIAGLPVCSAATTGKPMPVMAFGRRVDFGGAAYPKDKPVWFGVTTGGVVGAGQYLVPAAGVSPPRDPTTVPGPNAAARDSLAAQYGRILTAISATEGNLDAGNSSDSAMCSLGFQQWSMHVADQGPLLLERLKQVSPAYFDLTVGALGIQTGPAGTGPSATPTAPPPTRLGVITWIYALSPTNPPVGYGPGPGGRSTAAMRTDVFDWTSVTGGMAVGRRSILLSARWSVAARFGIDVWQAQVDCALARVGAVKAVVVAEAAAWAPVLAPPEVPAQAGAAPDVLELFGTEALMGLLVDMHVNTPKHLGPAMRRALLRAVAAMPLPAAPPPGGTATRPVPTDLFRAELLLAFLAERHFEGTRSGARGGLIDVAPERVRHLLTVPSGRVGRLRDTHASAALQAQLAALRIGDTEVLPWSAPVAWP